MTHVGDLVQIARPWETAGAARILSQELTDIPIYQDQAGRVPLELHGTFPDGTKGGDSKDDDHEEYQVLAEFKNELPQNVDVK